MIKHIFAFFFTIVSLFILISCNNNNTFTMGEELVDIKTNIISIDTSTIWSYTVKRDSVITSGYNTALIGVYNDGDFGKITASTSFEFSKPSSDYITDASAVYDSVALCLNYSHYYYGDTSQLFTVEAYKITDNLEDRFSANSGYLYNTTVINYDANNLLGTATVKPRPSRYDSIIIKISDQFGEDLFNNIRNQTPQVTNSDEFRKYLKGFTVRPGNNSTAILGFGVADTSLQLRLYYTYQSSDAQTIHTFLDLSTAQITAGSSYVFAQYNRIESSFASNNSLKNLHKLEDLVPSTSTNSQTYCQDGTGLMTKLEFPYLRQLLQTGTNVKILKAELILCPIRATYNTVALPKTLYLNYSDNLNTFGNYLTSEGYTLTPALTIDDHYNEKTQYSFDLTSYVESVLAETTNTIPALEVSVPYDQSKITLSRVILGDALHRVNTAKLKILYWRY